MDNVFIALSSFADYDSKPLDLLKASNIPYQVHSSGKRITKDELLANAKNATVIIAGVESYDEQILAGLEDLKCIVRCGVGVDCIDLATTKKRNITVLNTPDVPTLAVAELALALYLSLSRNLRPQANSMGAKKWERLESHLLYGKTIGIIGFGRIGRKIAELCKPFGVKIMFADPFVKQGSINSIMDLMWQRSLL